MCHGFMTHPFFFFMDFFHRISRMNQRQSCLSDYSRIFAEFWPLANGWRPICAAIVFSPTDFTDIHRFFFVGLFLSRRFHRYTQIFLRGIILSHRFHRFTQIFYGISGESLCPISGGICNDRTGRLRENP